MSHLPVEFVSLSGDKPLTDSRRVAKHFGKRHDNVLQAFDRMECSPEFNRLNFQVVETPDRKGEMRREVRMTKDGFMFLVMGFAGKEAARIKEAYINAFNAMHEHLQRRDTGLWKQMQALIAKEVNSQVRAAFGSSLLNKRRKEIPHFRRERERLEREIQQPLPLGPA